MKVAFTKKAKSYITLEEAPRAREIIESVKDENINELGQIAANIAGGSNSYEILKATAEIAKNSRVWGYYGDGTNNLDVWLEFYAFNEYEGFFEIGVYLSDLWQLGGDNANEIRGHMFISAYEYAQRGTAKCGYIKPCKMI